MKFFSASLLYFLLLPSFFQVHAQGLDNAGIGSTTTTAAYSSRLLKSTYSGFCYRVRRASDNAEAWIDFDAATKSVTANSNATIVLQGSSSLIPGTVMTFSTFYAGTSCYVTTWFDQSGNGYDAVQATSSAQPRIVNSGVIDVLAGKAALTFENVGQLLTYTAGNITVQTINAVRSAPNQSWQTLVAMSANTDWSVRGANSSLYNPFPNNNDWYYVTGSPNQVWIDGTQTSTTTTTAAHTITTNSAGPTVGTMSISTLFMSRGMHGGAKVVELTLFPASLSASDRAALQTNQNTNIVALPLQLINFTGSNNNGKNHLTWQTADESNTRRFAIERKIDNGNFTAVGEVAARGNGNGNYSYNDAVTASGKVYYRLKMEDLDGSFTYSNTVTLTVDHSAAARVYPNPANDKVFVEISDKNLLNTKARLLDVNGKVITVFTINTYKQAVNMSNLPAGMYMVQLNNGELLKVTKK